VNDLKNINFYAKIILDVDGKQVEVDSRQRCSGVCGQNGVPVTRESVLDKVAFCSAVKPQPIFEEGAAPKCSRSRRRHEEKDVLFSLLTLDLDFVNGKP
jgi:hypothetical protein